MTKSERTIKLIELADGLKLKQKPDEGSGTLWYKDLWVRTNNSAVVYYVNDTYTGKDVVQFIAAFLLYRHDQRVITIGDSVYNIRQQMAWRHFLSLFNLRLSCLTTALNLPRFFDVGLMKMAYDSNGTIPKIN